MKSTSNSFIKDSISIISSNIFLLLSGVLNGIILPKIMGVTQYGYYKVFSLYAGYIALLHFGFVDGMLLKYGGMDSSKINIKMLRSITRFFIGLQFFVSFIIFIISISFLKNIYRYIFCALSFFIIIYNLQIYFQYFSQAIMNFKLISKINILQSLLVSSIIVVNWIFFINNKIVKLYAMHYIALYESVFAIVLIIFLRVYRRLWLGEVYSYHKIACEIKELFVIGMPVMLSSQIASIILNLDNQIISIFFSPRVFGIYSFAYSLMMVITTVVSALSVVIFPFLNKKSVNNIMAQYSKNLGYLLIFIYGAIIVYYPAELFIRWYLPQYTESLLYFRLILPGIVISSSISILIFNYYKVIKKSSLYLFYSVIILISSTILNIIAYFITKNSYVIAFISLIILMSWFFLLNYYLIRKYKVQWKKNTIYLIVMVIIFESVSLIDNLYISMLIYIIFYFVISLVLYKKELVILLGDILNLTCK